MDSLLVCRSITYAQRMAAALNGTGIPASVVRTPVGAAQESCGYSVRIRDSALPRARRALEQTGLAPKKTLRPGPGGVWEEAGA